LSVNSKAALIILGIIIGSVIATSVFFALHYLSPTQQAGANTISFDIVACDFYGTSGTATNYVNVTVQNTGYSQFVIGTTAIVTGLGVVDTTKILPTQVPVAVGTSVAVEIPNVGWMDGNQYSIQLSTTNGEKITDVAMASRETSQESLYMSNLQVWYNTSGWAEAAFTLVNTGGTNAVLQSITAKSQPIAWSNVYYWITSTATISTLSPTNTQPNGSTVSPLINDTIQNLNVANGAITLKSGYTVVIYVNHPDSVGQNDVGTPVAVTVFTANAQWTQECNVQVAQPPPDQFNVASAFFMRVGASPTYTYVNMSIQNTGSSSWTITSPAQVNANTNVPAAVTGTDATSLTCLSGKTIYVTLTPTGGFTSGNQYSMTILMSDGNKITYVATAP
jgi:hypothetical protein